jgi:non-ribosomal peptide synthetase component F
VQSHQGDQEVFRWPAELSESVTRFSAAQHVTMFMTMLTAFAIVLYRRTGADDLLVGAPVAGRDSVAAEAAVGFFVNTVALRLRPRPATSFARLLAEVRDVTLAAQAHGDIPFDLVVESLRLPRDLARHPLVQVCFVVLASENEQLELPGLRCAMVHGHTGTSKFDLTVSLIGTRDGLRGVAEYDNRIFRRDTVQGLMTELRTVLLAGMADPERNIAALAAEEGVR